ncbi:4-hydroxybenzoate octaprenyltransferase [Neisseriaceae bacterium ESL0693]|nr:4-hydroxybenzoate octaprenyltransferase [Neisseriaceae bacterium ESL0693]
MKLSSGSDHKNISWFYLLERIHIYIQLMRLDRPIGILLLLWPTLWALLIAGQGVPDMKIVILFGLGTVLMRSAGCVINDYADRDFDGAVARTCNRPFALKKVSSKEALILTGVLCFLAALCLFPLNLLTWLLSLPALFLALTYPFTKRFFPIPQFYLGIAYSFGIPMAFAAQAGYVPLSAWVLMGANLFWTLAYDTIYAMADKEDDIKIGIKTSALTFGRHDLEMAMLCHLIFDALMMMVGLLIQAGWFYWLAVPIVMILQFRQYQMAKGRDRECCFRVFLSNNHVGMVWFLAILLDYLWPK